MRPFLSRREFQSLLAQRQPPCISIYVPTEKKLSEKRKIPIVYRNLLKAVGDSLAREYPRERRNFLERLRTLDQDDFWTGSQEGIAVFLAPDHFSHHRLPLPVNDLATVGTSFHTKPLVKLLHPRGGYHLLAVSQHFVAVYDGWRQILEPVEIPQLPGRLEDVVRTADLDRTTVHFHAGRSGDASPMYHSPGDEKAEIEADLLRYFKAIDDRVFHHVRDSRLPVVLATHGRYVPIYRRVSRIKSLLDRGVVTDAEHIAVEDLGKRAWEIVEEHEREQIGKSLDRFEEARSKGRGSEDVQEVAEHAAAGRVDTLLVDERRYIWSRLDRSTGRVDNSGGSGNPAATDLIDELVDLVLQMHGNVTVIEGESSRLPTGVAAIYRY